MQKEKITAHWLAKLVTFLLIPLLLILEFICHPVMVNGNSMYPTLEDGQIGITNVIAKNNLKRFDIVCIQTEEKILVKRVIGMPNEKIEYKDNNLYIDGVLMQESYLQPNVTTPNLIIQLSDDEYYCLGDNRTVSLDSRYYGPFNQKQIISKNIITIN